MRVSNIDLIRFPYFHLGRMISQLYNKYKQILKLPLINIHDLSQPVEKEYSVKNFNQPLIQQSTLTPLTNISALLHTSKQFCDSQRTDHQTDSVLLFITQFYLLAESLYPDCII